MSANLGLLETEQAAEDGTTFSGGALGFTQVKFMYVGFSFYRHYSLLVVFFFFFFLNDSPRLRTFTQMSDVKLLETDYIVLLVYGMASVTFVAEMFFFFSW